MIGACADGGGARRRRLPPPPDGRTPDRPVEGVRASAPSVGFVQPAAGGRFPRDGVRGHEWAARIVLRVEAVGVARVEYWLERALKLSTATEPPWRATVLLPWEGRRSLVARGLDDEGNEVARDRLWVRVAPPTDPSCHAMLDALGLDWSPAGSTTGVVDPVHVAPRIRGVAYRHVARDSPRPILTDCLFAPRLVELAELAGEYGVTEIAHLGLYSHRCIGGGEPDTGCRPSQHAYARAIDLHAFTLDDGDVVYDVETDWTITEGATCSEEPSGEPDRVLHELACRSFEHGIFHIVLTPNYDSAHRDHFHMDIKEGASFIETAIGGVDPSVGGLGD